MTLRYWGLKESKLWLKKFGSDKDTYWSFILGPLELTFFRKGVYND